MTDKEGAEPVAVAKLGLKRANLDERVLGDEDLKECPLVRLLGPTEAKQVIASSIGKRFSGGARVFKEGDCGDALLLVMKGEARLWVGAGTTVVEVAVVRKGEFMGEGDTFGEGAKRTYSAEAVGELELVEIPGALLFARAAKLPELQKHLTEIATTRKAAGEAMVDFVNRW